MQVWKEALLGAASRQTRAGEATKEQGRSGKRTNPISYSPLPCLQASSSYGTAESIRPLAYRERQAHGNTRVPARSSGEARSGTRARQGPYPHGGQQRRASSTAAHARAPGEGHGGERCSPGAKGARTPQRSVPLTADTGRASPRAARPGPAVPE